MAFAFDSSPSTSRPRVSELRAPKLDHAAFGNGRVIALVSPSSAIEWLCMPRFDSPSVFARLLDRDRGGSFRILHDDREVQGEMRYLPNTNVCSTRFESGDVAWEVIDFAPRIPHGLSIHIPIEIVRLIRPLRGHPRLSVDFDPRPDFARVEPKLIETARGVEVRGGAAPLELATNVSSAFVLGKRPFIVTEPVWFVFSWGTRSERPSLASVMHDLDRTTAGWRAWSKTCALPSFAAESVLRSALCLNLHAYHDTGAIIAAATTSIPEALGTERTWDYRYCWLRDGAFVAEALRRLGQLNEGERLIRYLRDVVEAGPLQPVYGIGGERRLDEHLLGHLAGFGGNGWVRVGNAASLQRQHDLMGEAVLCFETFLTDPRIVHEDPDAYFPMIERVVEHAILAADEPDTSIWEFRTLLRNYTFSLVMCWVALHRGAVLARRLRRDTLAARWDSIAEKFRERALSRGFNAELGYFTQTLDGDTPDASNLLLSTLGLVDARDPRFVSTVRASERLLVDRGLMMRYRSRDDLGETKSAFTICSFWWAEALALMGELDSAIEVFERVSRFANPVGLFSEDIDPESGALLGNFPQAYTHVGLIHAAMTIGELLEARDGRVRAWT